MLQYLKHLALVAIGILAVSALPQAEALSVKKHKHHLPPFSGNFTINQYQLYPENLDYDFSTGLLYLGCLWNASVGVYDPFAGSMVEVLEFTNITHNPAYHIGGLNVDRRSGLLSIVVDAGDAFNTNGQDISGTNWIMQWDPVSRELLYKINLTETAKGIYGGYQDCEQDPHNNVFVVGTYPSSIIRVDNKGKEVEMWYASPDKNTTLSGFSGLAAHDWLLLAPDFQTGSIWRFDMKAKKGIPYIVPLTPAYAIGKTGFNDALYLPPKYKGTVLLIAEDLLGVSVFRSKDGKWDSAEFLGVVPWTDPTWFVTAVVEIQQSLYMNIVPFGDSAVPGTAGNQSHFPFPDITKQVEALLAG